MHGSAMAQGKVVKRARDNDGNVISRSNDNPILDTREYVVEVNDGKEAALAAITNTQSMHTQCDPDGNQYVLVDLINDYC